MRCARKSPLTHDMQSQTFSLPMIILLSSGSISSKTLGRTRVSSQQLNLRLRARNATFLRTPSRRLLDRQFALQCDRSSTRYAERIQAYGILGPCNRTTRLAMNPHSAYVNVASAGILSSLPLVRSSMSASSRRATQDLLSR